METRLLKKIAQGNHRAFHRLYVLYKDKVYHTAIGYLQNIEEAEEITQDVFLTIYNKAETFRGKSKVSTWIYRITINKALNQLEKRKRLPLSGSEIQESHSVDFNHPGIQLENQEKAWFLLTAIDKLPANQKTAFILSYIEGLPRHEVGNIMGVTLKSIEGLLQRAKSQLRKQLISIYPEGKSKK
ncbi:MULTISPECIES: RNA polymerase sigma factor [Aquimarina]|uniref:RNA polymerase sigma factor n=1 Tax=Aquimarina algiphila TaxID=2047982 RepID=A0A554VLX3_9FLAO|nr:MULTISPECIES: RNA polymerase sigma factor [Aquimarina]TSE09179.1 RNA polymerase sigma factor [Aquimarina algiphila]